MAEAEAEAEADRLIDVAVLEPDADWERTLSRQAARVATVVRMPSKAEGVDTTGNAQACCGTFASRICVKYPLSIRSIVSILSASEL